MPQETGTPVVTPARAPSIEVGEQLFAKGDLAGAIACFRSVIANDPRDVDAYNNLGVIYWQQGNKP